MDDKEGPQSVFARWQSGHRKPIDFYGDLRSIHIEVGVMMFIIIALLVNAIIMLSHIPRVMGQDVYIVEGVRRGGQATVLWGVAPDPRVVAEINAANEEARIRAAEAQEMDAQRRASERAAMGIRDGEAIESTPVAD